VATRRSSGESDGQLAEVAAAAAVGIVAGLLVTFPAPQYAEGPEALPAAASKALSFTVQAHHLDITLEMPPVSPSMVGTVIYTSASSSAVESEVTTIYAPCAAAPSGGRKCAIGIRVPLGFHGQYVVSRSR
jgi:hypothetical protein